MIEHLTLDTFKQKVFNFEANTEWKFEGEKPAIIDFYADWCDHFELDFEPGPLIVFLKF